MSLFGPRARAAVLIVLGTVLGGALAPATLAPTALAAEAPDKSEVVLVLDFSASILRDSANRNRFGAALERIAARVDETSADLVGGDTTVSIVQFAAKAIDTPNCSEIQLLGNPENVTRLAGCLRSVAAAYRKGLDPALTKSIGVDTNYVAAMEQAATHLPADAVRPVMILFSDGKHDVKGVPIGQVKIAHDRLFGSRTPLALLPVGMGLAPKDRGALEAGLQRLKVIRNMPACVSGTAFEWPKVVFGTADDAGNAVAVALQDATCTFTVAPLPTATPAPVPSEVRTIRLSAHEGQIDLVWLPPASVATIIDYRVRCRAGDGDWIESTEGVSTLTRTSVDGLPPSASSYVCEVTAIGEGADGKPMTATVTPEGPPPAPGKPAVEALDGGITVTVPAPDTTTIDGYHYECSNDNGQTWSVNVDVLSSNGTTGQVGKVVNGTEYVCRAFAVNATGLSAASPLSDTVRPCGGLLDCSPVLVPILGILGILGVIGLILVILAIVRGRTRGYVVAVVDVVHNANLGHGSSLGIRFLRDPETKHVTGMVADRGRGADIKIRNLGGGRFVVRDARGRHETKSGDAVVLIDSLGVRHGLVLWSFATKAASPVSTSQ